MGGNIRTGEMEMLNTEEAREFFRNDFHSALDQEVSMEPEERERRHDEGPPIFHEEEIIEIRGGRFRVARVSKRGMLLRPVKG